MTLTLMPHAQVQTADETFHFDHPREQSTERDLIPPLEPGFERALRRYVEERLEAESKAQTSSDERLAALSYLLARTSGMGLKDVSAILSTSETQVRRWLHGIDPVPSNKYSRLKLVAEILWHLHGVLKEHASGRWFNTPVPALGGLTPLQAFRKGQARKVLLIARSYSDPSFA